MEHYSSFYRKNGILKLEGLKKFPIRRLSDTELPFNSVIHNWTFDQEEVGLTFSDPILVKHKANVLATFVKDYSNYINLYGSPIKVKANVGPIIETYYNKNQHIVRYIPNDKAPVNQNLIIAYNYNLVEANYKYTIQRFDTHIGRWLNRWTTLIETLDLVALKDDKQHFVKIDIPVNLPAPSNLKTISDYLTKFKEKWKPSNFKRELIDDYRADGLLTILDLWLWAGPNPEISHLSLLPFEKLKRINFIFSMGGNVATVNMGLVCSWIKRKDPLPGLTEHDGLIGPEEARKRLLHFFLTLTRTLSMSSEEITEINSIVDDGEEDKSPVADANIKIDTKNIDKNKVNINVSEDENDLKVRKPIIDTKWLKVERIDNDLTGGKTIELDGGIVTHDEEDYDEAVNLDLQQLEFVAAERKADDISGDSYKEYESVRDDPESRIEEMAKSMAKKGLMSAAELRRATTLANKYREIPSPFDPNKTIAEDMFINPNSLKIGEKTLLANDIKGVTDKSMLSSSLKVFGNKYINEIMHKDILSVVMAIQKVGVAVTDYQINRYEDINDNLEEHVIKLVPLNGKPSTVRFTFPKVDEDGNFTAASTKYTMRRQWSDQICRKVSPTDVALTSYYSKFFISRSDRASFNYDKWILNQLMARGISSEDTTVTDMSVNDVFDPNQITPRTYSAVSKQIAKFKSGDTTFSFNVNDIPKLFTEEEVNNGKSLGIPVGRKDDNSVVYMDSSSLLRYADGSTKLLEEVVGIPTEKIPLDMVEVEIFKKKIPIGLILAMYIGLGNLIKTLKVDCRRVKRGNNYNLTRDEFAVIFEDEALIFSKRDGLAQLVFNGFNRYKKDIAKYSVYQFDNPEIYGAVLDNNGINVSFIREFNYMRNMWIGPLEASELKEEKLPEDFVLLLIHATRLLTNDKHSDPMDVAEMRVKGYERFPGILYGKLTRAARVYASKTRSQFASVDLNPYDVWNTILKDETVIGVEDSNPIHSLKEQEIVVFRGSGGRSSQSMNADARKYHRNGMGMISEANPDNGDVGTINYLSADPNFDSVRGTSRRLGDTDGKAAKIISTTMLTYPGLDRDTPARVSFASIQTSATVHTENYTPLPTRTGYERVLIHRVNPLFGQVAQDDGEIINVTDKVITVRYKSEETVSFELGRRYGKWSGKVIPHEIKTPFKVGDQFKKGDTVIYNSKYFQMDSLFPNQALYKPGMLARTALMEIDDTYEDSSVISSKLAGRMVTEVTHVRDVKVPFDHHVRNLVKVGDTVELESILCTLHPDLAGSNHDFDNDEVTAALNRISSMAPSAKYAGKIERIEVIYSGSTEEMSASLQAIAEKSDMNLYKFRKQMGLKPIDGFVESTHRINNVPVGDRNAIIRIYIAGYNHMGVGDKLVFEHQMKSIVGYVHEDPIISVDDEKEVDAIFPYDGVMRRIVESAILVGTTDTLLVKLGELVVKASKQ